MQRAPRLCRIRCVQADVQRLARERSTPLRVYRFGISAISSTMPLERQKNIIPARRYN